MRKTTLWILALTVILAVLAIPFFSLKIALSILLLGLVLIIGLAIYRWRNDPSRIDASRRRLELSRQVGV